MRKIETHGANIRQISDGNGIALAVVADLRWFVLTSPEDVLLNWGVIGRAGYDPETGWDMIEFLRGN